MSYFFPGIIKNKSEFRDTVLEPIYSVSSGEHALRLIIKSVNFDKGSKIALPAFVCSSVARAIIEEGHIPVYLDLKNGNTFVTDYNFKILDREKPVAIILVHLYGMLHENNAAIEAYCVEKKIFLIQDLAQSFGLDVKNLHGDFPIVYSFGPGKSSTAAGGAMIKWNNTVLNKFKLPKPKAIAKIKAQLFLNSRIYGTKKSFIDLFIQKVIDKFFGHSASISQMSKFQIKAATYVMSKQSLLNEGRKARWQKIQSAIEQHQWLACAMPEGLCLHFKFVIDAKDHTLVFQQFLSKHQIPFYCLGNDIINEVAGDVPNFKKFALNFIEISTEAIIPMEEIERIALLIKGFNP